MRINRVFTDQHLAENGSIDLGPDTARHLVSVLRMKAGDQVSLFNGRGGEYAAEITSASHKSVSVTVGAFSPADNESPLQTLLGIGLSRGERFEWVLQKATELGVSEIFPLFTERTEVKLKGDREEKKQNRWQQVIISACEQCGRNRLPLLHPPQGLSHWLDTEADCKLVLHHRSSMTLADLKKSQPNSVALLIGPEGGLSEDEISQAENQDFQSLTLGSRVFRTETAPLVVLSLCQGFWGDF